MSYIIAVRFTESGKIHVLEFLSRMDALDFKREVATIWPGADMGCCDCVQSEPLLNNEVKE